MMYYSDLLTAEAKEIPCLKFRCLLDVVALTYKEELRKGKFKCHTETKTTTTVPAKEEEEEEEKDKRIFQRFPRKTRTSVKKIVTRRYPQGYYQNFNGASTSSSRNPRQWASSSSSLLLDLNTIPADDSNSEMNNPQNPKWVSLSFLGSCKIVAESENTEMMYPQSSNSQSSLSSCLTENKSRKRRAVQDNTRCGNSKKVKIATFSWIGKETPESLTQLMKDMNETVVKWGERTDLRLIFQKKLFKTDVNPGESRLSMPFNELIIKDFLTPAELRIMKEDINSDKKMGIGAILFDQRNVKWGMMLKRWEMKKDSGKGSWNYALTCGWNDVVKANGLKQGDDISVWSFRWGGLLCFALVTPPLSVAQSSSALDLCL